MLNNSGSYGSDEPPPNMVASINRQPSNASNINHNFNNFGKFVQQAASSASGYYETHNFHNFEQPPVNIPPIMHSFPAYQSIGHGSAYLSQGASFSYENAMPNYFPSVSSTQAEHQTNMLNFNPIYPVKLPPEGQASTGKESFIHKGYPLNIPQIPSRIFQRSPAIHTNHSNPQNIHENHSTSSSVPEVSTSVLQKNFTANYKDLNKETVLTPSPVIPPQNAPEKLHANIEQNDIETPKNLSQKPTENISNASPTIQRTSYNIVKNMNFTRNSILDKCMSETKRKSLEKTVKLIESILISSNSTKPEIIENNKDPLAFSPNPDTNNTNSSESKGIESDSDDKSLIMKLTTKNKRKSSAKQSTTKKVNISLPINKPSLEIMNEPLEIKIEDIKVEPMCWSDGDLENPFHRDCSGVSRDVIEDSVIVDMDSSVREALAIIESGSTTKSYFECPHCSLLLQHPKRFLIHTKWHTFGLLNEKRAEILKEREDRVKERREARTVQRLSASLAGDDSKPRFPCKDCDDVFPTKTSLKNHRRKSHPTAVTECRICLAPVAGLSELRAHMSCHEAAGLHQCPRCPKRFKYRHSLAKHSDTHREKTHSCTECDKLFGSLALVRLHMKTHERAARGASHRCAYCGKGFYEAYNLHVHERTHRNDKPFKCDICESCFVTNSSLKRHVKVSHSGAKPYTCQVCQKCFSSATIRDRHELRAHSDQQQFPHQCRLCPRRYMKTKDLRNHTYKMHPKEKKKSVASDTEQNSP